MHRVALRKESVDRNVGQGNGKAPLVVALRKESVDRNFLWGKMDLEITVALRKESVDRNCGVVSNSSAMAGRSPQGERG